MIEECKWSDKFVELQLWTRLASLSYQGKNHPLVVKCSKKALRFATVGTQPKNRKMDAYVIKAIVMLYKKNGINLIKLNFQSLDLKFVSYM